MILPGCIAPTVTIDAGHKSRISKIKGLRLIFANAQAAKPTKTEPTTTAATTLQNLDHLILPEKVLALLDGWTRYLRAAHRDPQYATTTTTAQQQQTIRPLVSWKVLSYVIHICQFFVKERNFLESINPAHSGLLQKTITTADFIGGYSYLTTSWLYKMQLI